MVNHLYRFTVERPKENRHASGVGDKDRNVASHLDSVIGGCEFGITVSPSLSANYTGVACSFFSSGVFMPGVSVPADLRIWYDCLLHGFGRPNNCMGV